MRPASRRRGLLVCSAVSVFALFSQPAAMAVRSLPRRSSAVEPLTTSAIAGDQRTPGAPIWVERYNGPGNSGDGAKSVRESPVGTEVFVTGFSVNSNGDADYATIAHDASTGAKLWVQRYNGPGNFGDAATSLGVSPDGSRVFVTGSSTGVAGNPDYATIAYDASTGATLWVERHNGPGNGADLPASLGVSPDGSRVFVTGSSTGVAGNPDYATIAYDASTGAQLWVQRYTAPTNGHEFASSLGVSPDGTKVFVTGGSQQPVSFHFATIAYDASTGRQLWLRDYHRLQFGNDYGTSLGVSPDGTKVFVTGPSHGGATDYDYATIAYDASTGTQLWVERYTRSVSGPDLSTSLGVSPDGTRVFVTGFGVVNPGIVDYDYSTVAYEARTGAQVWVKRYDGGEGSTDLAMALRVSPDSASVFVTGSSGGDYATVHYDASAGGQRWVARYDGPAGGNDSASSVAVSPDGKMALVTGESEGSGSDLDYATIAYSTN
jgi:outer membrane protein assembly factor BamB